MLGDLKHYINNRINLAKLEAVEAFSQLVASGFYIIFISFILLVTILLASVALGFFLGDWLNNIGLGFLIIAGFYLCLVIIFIVFKKSFQLKVTDKTIVKVIRKLKQIEDNSNE